MATTTLDARTERTERQIATGWAIGLVLAIVLTGLIFFAIRGLSGRGDLTERTEGPAALPIQETPAQQPELQPQTQPENTEGSGSAE